MLCARSTLIILLVGACISAPPSRAAILCAAGHKAARDLLRRQFDIVPCAVEKPGHRSIDDKASADLARKAGPLVDWIVAETGWAIRTFPPIKFVSHEELVKMFGGRADGIHVEALYSERDHSIYLPEGWRADNLRRRSILLHELVHHLQYLNHPKVTCQAELELQAFKLQVAWLSDQGVEDPLGLLGVNPKILFMLGKCDEMAH